MPQNPDLLPSQTPEQLIAKSKKLMASRVEQHKAAGSQKPEALIAKSKALLTPVKSKKSTDRGA